MFNFITWDGLIPYSVTEGWKCSIGIQHAIDSGLRSVALASRWPTAGQFDAWGSLPAPRAFLIAMFDLVSDRVDGLEQRRAQGVIARFHDHIRSRSHEVKRRAEGRTFGQAAFEVNPRFIDLKIW